MDAIDDISDDQYETEPDLLTHLLSLRLSIILFGGIVEAYKQGCMLQWMSE